MKPVIIILISCFFMSGCVLAKKAAFNVVSAAAVGQGLDAINEKEPNYGPPEYTPSDDYCEMYPKEEVCLDR
jgi:hypothetical protein